MAVRTPRQCDIGRGMPGEPFGDAADRRHDKYIDIAVIFAGERDQRSVRREDRVGFETRPRGQPSGIAALSRHAPQVARIREDNLTAAQSRLLKQQRRTGITESGNREQNGAGKHAKLRHRKPPCGWSSISQAAVHGFFGWKS